MADTESKASWNSEMERFLLESVLAAKSDPEMFTGKGLKTHAWRKIQIKVEKRFGVKFKGDGRCQQKYARVMALYDKYVELSSKSGAGIDDEASRVRLDADTWTQLLAVADKASKTNIRTIQKSGFQHVEVCELLKGDIGPKGASGDSIASFLKSKAASTNDAAKSSSKKTPRADDGESSNEDDKEGDGKDHPPSHKQRKERAKRHRDGRHKHTISNDLEARANEAFIAVCKASEAYFTSRMKKRRTVEISSEDEDDE